MIKRGSKKAFICMVVARAKCKGIDIEQAIRETITRGHCGDPESITDVQMESLRIEISKAIEKSTQKGA